MPATDFVKTTCCVVGGGPAGMMLGYMLARANVPVVVLEKHPDFFRDFRGDTVHPSTLQVLHELDLLEDFLKLPHDKVYTGGAVVGGFAFPVADFRAVPAVCKFVAMMPQWDFLNFLSERARRFPAFDLRMQHEVVDLMRDGERISGVVARGPNDTTLHVSADLVVGCDGRHAVTRRAAQLERLDFGVPIDVLWFRISRRPGDPAEVLGNFNYGKFLILINRNHYFQAGLIIRKGSVDEIKQRGLDRFRETLLQIAPFLDGRVNEIQDWDQIKLLTVQINRLRRWSRPGLLCIGDAAHAMSPAGGVGINLAIQDAVAAANLLTPSLRQGRVPQSVLDAVQKRREFPTRVTQAMQVRIHNRMERMFENTGPVNVPWQLKAAVRIPGINHALGCAVGMGVRPEHVGGPPRPNPMRKVAIGAAIGIAVGVLIWRGRRFRRA